MKRKLLVITPWGAPSGWKEVCYRWDFDGISGMEKSRTTTYVFQKVAEALLREREKDSYHIFVLAADTLWVPEGLEGGVTYSQIVPVVEEKVKGFFKDFGIEQKDLTLLIAPGIGRFNPRGTDIWVSFFRETDKLKSTVDYKVVSFLKFVREFMGMLNEGDEVELWLDITHGVNYMPVLSYSNLIHLSRWVALWTGKEVKVKVLQSSPVFPAEGNLSDIVVLREFTSEPTFPLGDELKGIMGAYKMDQMMHLSTYLEAPRRLRGQVSREFLERLRGAERLVGESVEAFLLATNWLVAPLLFLVDWDTVQTSRLEGFLNEFLDELLGIYYNDAFFEVKVEKGAKEVRVIRKHSLREAVIELALLVASIRRLRLELEPFLTGSHISVGKLKELYSSKVLDLVNGKRALKELGKHEIGRIAKDVLSEMTDEVEGGRELILKDLLQQLRQRKGLPLLNISDEFVPRNFLAHGGLEYNSTLVKLEGKDWQLRVSLSEGARESLMRYLLEV